MPKFISFIPTQNEWIDCFFELVKLSDSDVVYDLGSGDGRLLFAALENGAGKVVGVDIDPELVIRATETARSKGFEDKATFIESDVMEANLSDATVVLCYLCTSASSALKPKLEVELNPGTRVVMESFPVPGWKPVQTFNKEYRQFFLYIMPPEESDEYNNYGSSEFYCDHFFY